MEISIILPIYNVEKYIERCINSIIAQTFTDYEIILVDDASPDNALRVAEKLLKENHIAFQSIKHETNQGLSEARNSGLKIAKGKYVMFVDSDDKLTHNTVLIQFYETIEREQADFVCANFYRVYEGDKQKTTYIKGIDEDKVLQNSEILTALCRTEMSVSAWNKLIRRIFLLENNLFFQKGLLHEDELWTFQMCLVAKKCYCLSNCLYDYHKDNDFSITKNMTEKSYDDKLFILQQQLNIIKEKQLINKENKAIFIDHFKRISGEILHPELLVDKLLWTDYYGKISTLYQQSELWQYKKIFRFPTRIAYWARKERYKNWKNKGNKSYGKLLNILHRYNEE